MAQDSKQNKLTSLTVRNFRALADVKLQLGPLNIFFGPNGAGKSSLLDTLWFVHDCAIRGVNEASAFRNQGAGLLWDGATGEASISILLKTMGAEYEVEFGYLDGRLDKAVGERLRGRRVSVDLFIRNVGTQRGKVWLFGRENYETRDFSYSTDLGLMYLKFDEDNAAESVKKLLTNINFYFSRAADFRPIRKFGSQSTTDLIPLEDGQNIWAVLRNLRERNVFDKRYETILRFMRQAFPTFRDLFIEQTGTQWVYGHFIEKGLRKPVSVAAVSDGHLQMLLHLTALFCHEPTENALIMFDEPEASLHPHVIAVFAEAVKLAVNEWNKQVFIATHSPVLLSQFDAGCIFAVGKKDGATFMNRVSELSEIEDLLEEYALGSLYMAEMVAPQSKELAGVEG